VTSLGFRHAAQLLILGTASGNDSTHNVRGFGVRRMSKIVAHLTNGIELTTLTTLEQALLVVADHLNIAYGRSEVESLREGWLRSLRIYWNMRHDQYVPSEQLTRVSPRHLFMTLAYGTL
jgi:hypothetical protein